MSVTTKGERELALRFETFPSRVHDRLRERIGSLIDRLEARVEERAPYRTGELKSEIKGRVFADMRDRVAGYVDVFAGSGDENAYAKAASLEYGVTKAREPRAGAILGRLGKRRAELRLAGVVHIPAFRYLRDPLSEMRGEIDAELLAALNETVAEGE